MSVDFDKLRDINEKLEQLHDDGTLTQSKFDALFADAESAVGDDRDFLEGVRMLGLMWGFIKRGATSAA